MRDDFVRPARAVRAREHYSPSPPGYDLERLGMSERDRCLLPPPPGFEAEHEARLAAVEARVRAELRRLGLWREGDDR